MGNLITIRAADSAHWYAKDGTPRHEATLREARKEGLYPSVTSVLDLKRKPGLDNWKLSQLLAQALTMTREAGEGDESFIARIVASDAEERAKAPDLGTDVHTQLADYITGAEAHPRSPDVDMGLVVAWIDEHVTRGANTERRFVDIVNGFAGCIDYFGHVDGCPAIIDWKTQGVKLNKRTGRPDPQFYDEWCWQLAAYREGGPYGAAALWSVIIDTARPGVYAKRWTEAEAARGWSGFLGLLAAWCADRNYYPMEAQA